MPSRRLRVLIVTSRDSGGGAPRAIHRIYRALRDHCSDQADVFLRVVHKSFDDAGIIGGKPQRNRAERAEYLLRTRFRKYFPRLPFISDNKILHSQALYRTGLGREINAMKPDVIMLGWLGNSTLSIREIGQLNAPVVWRLSDMWVFSGAEHYATDRRYARSYRRGTRPTTEAGPDINRETFLRKKRSWTKPHTVISPSRWMAEQVMQSTLTHDWATHVIPNTLNSSDWEPLEKKDARRALGLPKDAHMVLFGAGSGLRDHHKGGDLFLESLNHLQVNGPTGSTPAIWAAIFGQDGDDFVSNGVRVTFLGRLSDHGLRLAYSSANVMVVPSRVDNYPSTAVEARMTGLPVVGFDVGGLPDIVVNNQTGVLVEDFEPRKLGSTISDLLNNPKEAQSMGLRARSRAIELWDPRFVAGEYLAVLRDAATKTL